jgi:hypothetical protein
MQKSTYRNVPKAIENILTLARQLGIENGKPFPKELKKPQSLITDCAKISFPQP